MSDIKVFFQWVDHMIQDLNILILRIHQYINQQQLNHPSLNQSSRMLFNRTSSGNALSNGNNSGNSAVSRLLQINQILHEMVQQTFRWKSHPNSLAFLWEKAPESLTQEMRLYDQTVHSVYHHLNVLG